MKKYILAGALAFVATQALAQGSHPKQYDPFFALPGKAGTTGVDGGLANSKISKIADMSDVLVMGKYSLNDKIELGARATLGFLAGDNADAFRSLVVGAKYGLGEKFALGVNLLAPAGEADDPGLSIAIMHTKTWGSISCNHMLQANLLDGFTGGVGTGLHLFVEPNKAIGSKMVGYLDILVNTNTDDIAGDYLGIDLGPNVDYKINGKTVLNVGVSLGLAGDAKQADPGINATLIWLCAK